MDPLSQYDLLIIGGGASGAGVALDAASRGLKCAVIDSNDFAGGTSSRSTKMAHGGLRYLENMMLLKGDPFENYELLKETLHERNYFMQAAPYQNKQLSLLIPCKSFIQSVFYFYPGALLYHLIYLLQFRKSNYQTKIEMPQTLSRVDVIKQFINLPQLSGCYGVRLNEVQMLDSRMNLHVLLTSSIDNYIPGMKGSTLANYVEFQDFLKDSEGKIYGAILYDKLNQVRFSVKSKVVVNCTGIQADAVRLKDNPKAEKRIIGARGTHLVFSKESINVPEGNGIIVPQTKDGRLVFIINYLGHAMVGTTDDKCEISENIKPEESDIEFLIDELKQVFGDKIDYKKHIISHWAGIRPLVIESPEDKHIQDDQQRTLLYKSVNILRPLIIKLGKLIHAQPGDSTASISRNHAIEFSDSGLVSLMGGKWTSFRSMGYETVELILKTHLKDNNYAKSQTMNFSLIGSNNSSSSQASSSSQQFQKCEDTLVFKHHIPRDCAQHLIHSYGLLSSRVIELGEKSNLNQRIHPDYPFLKSELLYAVRYEMAQKPNDILCRRVPIAFVNSQIARDLIKEVVDIMGQEKLWSEERKIKEVKEALELIEYMK